MTYHKRSSWIYGVVLWSRRRTSFTSRRTVSSMPIFPRSLLLSQLLHDQVPPTPSFPLIQITALQFPFLTMLHYQPEFCRLSIPDPPRMAERLHPLHRRRQYQDDLNISISEFGTHHRLGALLVFFHSSWPSSSSKVQLGWSSIWARTWCFDLARCFESG